MRLNIQSGGLQLSGRTGYQSIGPQAQESEELVLSEEVRSIEPTNALRALRGNRNESSAENEYDERKTKPDG